MMKTPLFFLLIGIAVFIPATSYAQDLAIRQDESVYINKHSANVTPAAFSFIVGTQAYIELEKKLRNIPANMIRKHPLDKEVARHFMLFEETYSYISAPAPGIMSGDKIIQKPVIFKSVSKIEKYYRKSWRNGSIPKEKASTQLIDILDTAILLFRQDTRSFEDMLKNVQSPERMAEIFLQIEIIPPEA